MIEFIDLKNQQARIKDKIDAGIQGWSEVAMYFPGIPPSATFKLAK